ncbi:MAG: guanylate kinase [Bacteroidetes bacterium]|nr:guanylate kinase [Bacteroidota bacterium]
MEGQIIIISAPSGAGKTTLVRALMQRLPQLMFSVSATTRAPRAHEQDGIDYHFLSVAQFQQHIQQGDFLEWEEVYTGRYYGTLVTEPERILKTGHIPLFEVDAVGGIHLKEQFRSRALCIFVKPPTREALRERLIKRGTDSLEEIDRRMQKADFELGLAPRFDVQVLNADLETAITEIEQHIRQFLAL